MFFGVLDFNAGNSQFQSFSRFLYSVVWPKNAWGSVCGVLLVYRCAADAFFLLDFVIFAGDAF